MCPRDTSPFLLLLSAKAWKQQYSLFVSVWWLFPRAAAGGVPNVSPTSSWKWDHQAEIFDYQLRSCEILIHPGNHLYSGKQPWPQSTTLAQPKITAGFYVETDIQHRILMRDLLTKSHMRSYLSSSNKRIFLMSDRYRIVAWKDADTEAWRWIPDRHLFDCALLLTPPL